MMCVLIGAVFMLIFAGPIGAVLYLGFVGVLFFIGAASGLVAAGAKEVLNSTNSNKRAATAKKRFNRVRQSKDEVEGVECDEQYYEKQRRLAEGKKSDDEPPQIAPSSPQRSSSARPKLKIQKPQKGP